MKIVTNEHAIIVVLNTIGGNLLEVPVRKDLDDLASWLKLHQMEEVIPVDVCIP